MRWMQLSCEHISTCADCQENGERSRLAAVAEQDRLLADAKFRIRALEQRLDVCEEVMASRLWRMVVPVRDLKRKVAGRRAARG